jgi:hypothetical protein
MKKITLLFLLASVLVIAGCGSTPANPKVLKLPDAKNGNNYPTRSLNYESDVIYMKTELGRHLICVNASKLEYGGGAYSCDFAAYHHRYGWGDPFDQKP